MQGAVPNFLEVQRIVLGDYSGQSSWSRRETPQSGRDWGAARASAGRHRRRHARCIATLRWTAAGSDARAHPRRGDGIRSYETRRQRLRNSFDADGAFSKFSVTALCYLTDSLLSASRRLARPYM